MNSEEMLFRHFGLNMDEGKTMRQISIDTGIAYMTLNRIIKELGKKGLVNTKKQGKAIICALNKNNPLTKQHIILASDAFKNELIEKKPLLKEISRIIQAITAQNTSAILFGSYAKSTEQKHSDIDIAIISNTKETAKKIRLII